MRRCPPDHDDGALAALQTGEEGEIVRADFKCKLYRFDPESSEWKERGVGQVKLLEHKENHKIRLLMRQEKTLKIRANHIGELHPCS